jgi:hypothetical protein
MAARDKKTSKEVQAAALAWAEFLYEEYTRLKRLKELKHVKMTLKATNHDTFRSK